MRSDAGSREDRFRSLYEDHADRVAGYAARRAAPADVGDVVAETFLVAWRRLDEVPRDALPWLLATARGTLANRHRAARRRRALAERLTAQPANATEHDPGHADVDRRLLAAIAELPEAEREAFLLVAWDGLGGSRAARAAGCSAATFRMRLHRARRRLRRHVQHLDEPTQPAEARTTVEDLP